LLDFFLDFGREDFGTERTVLMAAFNRSKGVCVVIVPHLSAADHPTAAQQACGDLTIPFKAIVQITDLAPTVIPALA
jgi:hypothetical protein